SAELRAPSEIPRLQAGEDVNGNNCEEEVSGFACSFFIHPAFDSPIGGPETLYIASMNYGRKYAGSNG
ncbi:hypothetical protein ACDY97_17895, partial [Rhizobium mongolense]|uniref:hypothetical protein n=1 Tax=Rhizobium mongolense TaxID=57676 RepID=UPI0035562E76